MRRSKWQVATFLAISGEVTSPRMTKEDNKVRPSEAPHPVRAESQQACDARIYPLADSLLTAARRILEMIPAGASLTDILTNLCTAIDDHNSDMMSIVMLMDADGQRLWPAAAPRMPSDFVKAISPLMIGENMASCGTAAFRRERVILSDVATDPLMSGLPAGLRELVLAQGLRAQWSQPLFSKHNEVLGTFGLFHGTPRSPTDRQLQLIEDAATIAVIAIEGERSRAALKQAFLDIQTSEQELRSIVEARTGVPCTRTAQFSNTRDSRLKKSWPRTLAFECFIPTMWRGSRMSGGRRSRVACRSKTSSAHDARMGSTGGSSSGTVLCVTSRVG